MLDFFRRKDFTRRVTDICDSEPPHYHLDCGHMFFVDGPIQQGQRVQCIKCRAGIDPEEDQASMIAILAHASSEKPHSVEVTIYMLEEDEEEEDEIPDVFNRTTFNWED